MARTTRSLIWLMLVVPVLLSACSSPGGGAGPALSILLTLEKQVGQPRGLAFTPDGQSLAVAAANFDSGRSSVQIYNVADGSPVRKLDVPFGTGALFSPDGTTLAVNTNERVLLWRASDWTLANTIAPTLVTSRTIPVVGFAFSPDGAVLATRSSTYPIGGQVDTWRVSDGTHIKTLLPQVGEGDYLVFTPDGKSIVTETDTKAQIWNVADSTLVRTLDEATGILGTSLAVSPNGETLATGSTILWRLADGARLRELRTGETIASIAFSPDGAMLATGAWSADDKVQLWRVEDGQLLNEGDGGGGTVVSVAFSPDGKILASGSVDGVVRLWKVK